MKKLISTLPDYLFVLHHEVGPDEHAVLLTKDGAYSVCKMQPRRLIALAPNYLAEGHGLLSGPLTRDGLADLLQWTDRGTASIRYRLLANLPPNVVMLHDRRPSG